MDSLQEQSILVADVLKDAIERLNAIPTRQDFHMVKTRVVTGLQRQVNELVTQSGGNVEAAPHDYSAPLTSVLGIKIPAKVAADTGLDPNKGNTMAPPTAPLKTAEEIEEDELREIRDKLYDQFLEIETDQILDKHADIEIRAVAKYAGLPVTQKHPKNIDAKYVNQIKATILKKKDLEEKGKIGEEDNDGEEGNDENE